MNFGGSVKVDAGASLKGVTDAAAKAKDAVKAAEDAASQAKSAVTGAVDAAKAQVSDAVNSAKDAVAGAVATAKATVSAAVAAAEEKAAAVKEQCLAAKEKFQNTVAPADGWKAAFATGTQISIGKSFGQTAGITLGNLGDFMLSDALTIVFEEDPESVDKQNDKFILFSTDEAKTYRQEKTVKDDIEEDDDKLTIEFTGLNKELSYSLQVDSGDGYSYFFFENRPYGDWMGEAQANTFRVTFQIDPNDVACQDDTFVLMSTDAAGTYRQTKTVKDDLVSGNNTMDLLFEELDPALSYSLQVNPGAEGAPYFLFENKQYGQW